MELEWKKNRVRLILFHYFVGATYQHLLEFLQCACTDVLGYGLKCEELTILNAKFALQTFEYMSQYSLREHQTPTSVLWYFDFLCIFEWSSSIGKMNKYENRASQKHQLKCSFISARTQRVKKNVYILLTNTIFRFLHKDFAKLKFASWSSQFVLFCCFQL